jgi:replication-associated recombination protein RarA
MMLIHPITQKVLDAYGKQPVHGLLLHGPEGIGLGTLARSLAEKLTEHATDATVIVPEQATIPIERIRLLYEETRSVHKRAQVIIIDDADTLSMEAQNALLKLLEEPVHNVYFILTTHKYEGLLPTIRSRTQAVSVQRVTPKQSEQLLEKLKLTDSKKRQQALFLASGLPAELSRLAGDDDYFRGQVKYVEDARAILQGSTYERLRIITAYTDRMAALRLVTVIEHLIRFSVLKQKQLASISAVDVLDLVSERISGNGHVRTQLMYLMTRLP